MEIKKKLDLVFGIECGEVELKIKDPGLFAELAKKELEETIFVHSKDETVPEAIETPETQNEASQGPGEDAPKMPEPAALGGIDLKVAEMEDFIDLAKKIMAVVEKENAA